jgi:hypothetical protein
MHAACQPASEEHWSAVNAAALVTEYEWRPLETLGADGF